MKRIQVIDSHTGGEPTRVVISGGPDLGGSSVAEQLKVFAAQHDRFRSAVVNEPRGSDVLVGALLCPPADKSCVAGVIFFNNVGVLQMCGHGTIGLVVTLAHLVFLRHLRSVLIVTLPLPLASRITDARRRMSPE